MNKKPEVKAINLEGKERCNSCRQFRLPDDFIKIDYLTKQPKQMKSCIECRRRYIQAKQQEQTLK